MTREARRKPGEVDSKKPREKCFQGGGQFVICGYKIKPQEKWELSTVMEIFGEGLWRMLEQKPKENG